MLSKETYTFDAAIDGQTGNGTLYGLRQGIENKANTVRQSLPIS
jgi:hypothetical protein